MPDDVAAALREIAGLLQQQVDHTAEMSKRTQERLASMPRPKMPDFTKVQAEFRAETRAGREDGKRQHAEDMVFRDRLLSVLEGQNELLARLVDHLAPNQRQGSRRKSPIKPMKVSGKPRKVTRRRPTSS